MKPVVTITYNVEKDVFEVRCREKLISSQHTMLKATKKLAAYVKGQEDDK